MEKGRFELIDKPKPELQDPKDAIVAEPIRIKHTAVPITTTIRRGIIASK